MQIKHLSHEHPLVLIDKENFVEQNCSKCQENILGPIYSCQKCNYFMCKSCVGYPHQIHHLSHHHPLTLRDMKVGETKHCKGCFERISKQAYNCSDCGFQLHKSCADLPNKISHPSHPTHSLTLLYKHPIEDTFNCHHCKKTKPGFTLCCVQCNIYLDVHCAFSRIEVITEEVRLSYFSGRFLSQGEFEIFSHRHRLNHESAYKCKQKCPACKLAIADYSSMYRCPKCVYTIHDKCAFLSQTLEHPSHPNHSLTLLVESPYESLGDFWCNGCYRDIGGFTYHCSECKFDLDVQCASFMPSMKYEYHDHPLTLFEKTTHDFWCDACGTNCSKNFYRCVDCDFNVHVQCVLLPSSLKHGCHKDPLKLTKYITTGKDTEVFYCHACEKERNTDLNVYCCIDCDFISEIECVFPGVSPYSSSHFCIELYAIVLDLLSTHTLQDFLLRSNIFFFTQSHLISPEIQCFNFIFLFLVKMIQKELF